MAKVISSLTVDACVIAGNAAGGTATDAVGGGVACHGCERLTIQAKGASAVSTPLASAAVAGLMPADVDTSVAATWFVSNRVPAGSGGAVSVQETPQLQVASSRFMRNAADLGAGLWAATSFGSVASSVFNSNAATVGPAVAWSEVALVTVSDCSFANNTGSGGTVFSGFPVPFACSGSCVFQGNSAADVGTVPAMLAWVDAAPSLVSGVAINGGVAKIHMLDAYGAVSVRPDATCVASATDSDGFAVPLFYASSYKTSGGIAVLQPFAVVAPAGDYTLKVACTLASGRVLSASRSLTVIPVKLLWATPPPTAIVPASAALSGFVLDPAPALQLVDAANQPIGQLLASVSCTLNAGLIGSAASGSAAVSVLGDATVVLDDDDGAAPVATFNAVRVTGPLGSPVRLGSTCTTVSGDVVQAPDATRTFMDLEVVWVGPDAGAELQYSSPVMSPTPTVRIQTTTGQSTDLALTCTVELSSPAASVVLHGAVVASANPADGVVAFSDVGLVAPFGESVDLRVTCAWIDGQQVVSPVRTVNVRSVVVEVVSIPAYTLGATPFHVTLHVSSGSGVAWNNSWPTLSCGVTANNVILFNVGGACAQVVDSVAKVLVVSGAHAGTAASYTATCSTAPCDRLAAGSTVDVDLPEVIFQQLTLEPVGHVPEFWPPSSGSVILPMFPPARARVLNHTGQPLIGSAASGTLDTPPWPAAPVLM